MRSSRRLATWAAALAAAALFLCAPARAQTPAVTTNSSVSVTTGNTYQTLLSALTTGQQVRHSLTIQNNNTNGDNCLIIIGTTAITSGTTTASTSITVGGVTQAASKFSILLGQGGSYQRYYPYVPADAIYGTCTTTADSIYVDTQ